MEAHVCAQEIARRKHVVVHEQDVRAARAGDAHIPPPRQSRIFLPDDVQRARRAQGRDDLLVRAVGRTVVDQDDFVVVGIEILIEEGVEHAS